LWQDVGIKDYKRLPLGMPVALGSTGILAFDGDRSYDLAKVSPLAARVERDGPWIIDPQHIMRLAMKDQMLLVST
jgi:hypothetical protein